MGYGGSEWYQMLRTDEMNDDIGNNNQKQNRQESHKTVRNNLRITWDKE